jgi:hypothetical protein
MTTTEHDETTQTPLQAAAEESAEEERTLAGHRIRVTMEGPGDELVVHVVRVDNRDFVRWDMTAPRQKWGSAKEVPFLFQTFLSWSAGKRAGLELPPFERYRDLVLEAKDLEQEEEDEARPTR